MRRLIVAILVLLGRASAHAQTTCVVRIPTAQAPRTAAAVAAYYGYTPQIVDGTGAVIPNPETAEHFARRQLIEQIRRIVADREVTVDTAATLAAKQAEVSGALPTPAPGQTP